MRFKWLLYDRKGDKFIVVVQVKAVWVSEGKSFPIDFVGDLVRKEDVVVSND